MPGVKTAARLKSFMTAPTLYRTIASADGAVNPAAPPVVPLLDLSKSPQGLNTVQIFATPAAGAAPVLELWAIIGTSWFFVATKTLASGRPEALVVENVPAANIAIVLVSGIGGGPTTLTVSTSN